MELKEFYQAIGSDFDEIFKRFGNEQLILKFVKSFEKDKSFSELCEGFEEKDIEKAFRAAHTLKGVAQNLDFGDLGRSAAALTEALRGTKPLEDYSLYESVVQAQTALTNAISALENG